MKELEATKIRLEEKDHDLEEEKERLLKQTTYGKGLKKKHDSAAKLLGKETRKTRELEARIEELIEDSGLNKVQMKNEMTKMVLINNLF